MTDSYWKPANLTPALLWPSTAIRFQTRDKRKNRAPATLPSNSMPERLWKKKLLIFGRCIIKASLVKTLWSRGQLYYLSQLLNGHKHDYSQVEARGI